MCLCAFELIFSWRYQECILVSRFKRRGMVPGIGMDPGEYCTWGFCKLTVISGMRIGPVRGLSARQ